MTVIIEYYKFLLSSKPVNYNTAQFICQVFPRDYKISDTF